LDNDLDYDDDEGMIINIKPELGMDTIRLKVNDTNGYSDEEKTTLKIHIPINNILEKLENIETQVEDLTDEIGKVQVGQEKISTLIQTSVLILSILSITIIALQISSYRIK
jgi:hypothetical protein